MRVIKDTNSYELTLINENNDKFVIHYAAGDLYWTMVDYYEENEFIISSDDKLLFDLMENLFTEIRLYDKPYRKSLNDNCFSWVSESYGLFEKANMLTIKKIEDTYVIKFFQNPNKLFLKKDICSICFCLSGSRYQDIANAFSLMLHDYMELDNLKIKKLK